MERKRRSEEFGGFDCEWHRCYKRSDYSCRQIVSFPSVLQNKCSFCLYLNQTSSQPRNCALRRSDSFSAQELNGRRRAEPTFVYFFLFKQKISPTIPIRNYKTKQDKHNRQITQTKFTLSPSTHFLAHSLSSSQSAPKTVCLMVSTVTSAFSILYCAATLMKSC